MKNNIVIADGIKKSLHSEFQQKNTKMYHKIWSRKAFLESQLERFFLQKRFL
jgi:hypothetical protein